MNILPFQADIAARMLVNTENEQIHPAAQFIHTHNGYWLAWHDGIAALLAPNTPADEPCFWVEGASDLAELVSMVENGDFDVMEDFEGDEEAWQHTAECCHHAHHHSDDTNCSH